MSPHKEPLVQTDQALLCEECWYIVRIATQEYKVDDKYPYKYPIEKGPSTCDLCRLLEQAIAAFRDSQPQLQGTVGRLPERQKLTLYDGARYPSIGVCVAYSIPGGNVAAEDEEIEVNDDGDLSVHDIELSDGTNEKINFSNGDHTLSRERIVENVELEITTPPDQNLPWAGFAHAISVADHSASEECFTKVETWMAECISNHPGCVKSQGDGESGGGAAKLPRRLIDTGPLHGPRVDPRLLECEGDNHPDMRYCALSYCWGEHANPKLTTTKANYQDRLTGFPLEELPQTFQDAIRVTRRLGCRYVWIDAFCIVQGDREDWENEAPRMQSIYGNAHLVIAATHSSSPADGIFSPRATSATFSFACGRIDKPFDVTVRRRIEHDVWQDRGGVRFHGPNAVDVPLHSRAWAFQERLLGQRVVHFARHELVFECKTHCRCECSGLSWPQQHPGAYDKYKPGSSLKAEFTSAARAGREKKQAPILEAWRSIVSQYTARNLTVQSDLLPALSGVARHFAAPTMGKYMAGMWTAELPDALDWTHKDPDPETGSTVGRTAQYRGPTWSWASCHGQITCVPHGGANELELVDVACTPATKDPYGEVSDGYVVVRGQLGPLDGRDHDRKTAKWLQDSTTYDLDEDDHTGVWALKMSFSDWNIWHVLLLKKSSRVPGAWERVGIDSAVDKVFSGRGRTCVKIV